MHIYIFYVYDYSLLLYDVKIREFLRELLLFQMGTWSCIRQAEKIIKIMIIYRTWTSSKNHDIHVYISISIHVCVYTYIYMYTMFKKTNVWFSFTSLPDGCWEPTFDISVLRRANERQRRNSRSRREKPGLRTDSLGTLW